MHDIVMSSMVPFFERMARVPRTSSQDDHEKEITARTFLLEVYAHIRIDEYMYTRIYHRYKTNDI